MRWRGSLRLHENTIEDVQADRLTTQGKTFCHHFISRVHSSKGVDLGQWGYEIGDHYSVRRSTNSILTS